MNRRWIAGLSLALVLVAICAGVALAQDGGTKQVGLVIGLPDNKQHLEIVTLPANGTTFQALQKAGVKIESADTQFGPAVCSINGTGCPSSNCFCDAKRFWAFYHLDAANTKWVSSQEGVGNAVPANGAVEGFVWSETDANFNPTTQPPAYSFAQIQAQSGAPVTRWLIPVLVVLVVAAALFVYLRRARRPAAR